MNNSKPLPTTKCATARAATRRLQRLTIEQYIRVQSELQARLAHLHIAAPKRVIHPIFAKPVRIQFPIKETL